MYTKSAVTITKMKISKSLRRLLFISTCGFFLASLARDVYALSARGTFFLIMRGNVCLFYRTFIFVKTIGGVGSAKPGT